MITLSTFWVAIILGIFGVATPMILITRNKTIKMKKVNKITSLIGVGLFIVFTCLLTLTETYINSKVIGIRFSQSSQWFSKSFMFDFSHINLEHSILNLLMLLPLGVMSSQYFISTDAKHPILKGMVTGLLFSTLIETMQCIMPINRTPDFADILFNTIGSLAGASTIVGYEKLYSYISHKIIYKQKHTECEQDKQAICTAEKFIQNELDIKNTKLVNKESRVRYTNLYVNQTFFKDNKANAQNNKYDIQSRN